MMPTRRDKADTGIGANLNRRHAPRAARSWRMNAGGIRVDFNNMFTAMVKALLTSCWQRGRAVEADCRRREIQLLP